jgi:CxxC motif-containing protein
MERRRSDTQSREMVCISCPIGCRLTVRWESIEQGVRVSGNRCAKGESYALEEVQAPKRVLTATVLVRTARGRERLPVKTSRPLAGEHIPELLAEIYRWQLEAPVRLGQVLLPDIAGSGVDVVATRSLEA